MFKTRPIAIEQFKIKKIKAEPLMFKQLILVVNTNERGVNVGDCVGLEAERGLVSGLGNLTMQGWND